MVFKTVLEQTSTVSLIYLIQLISSLEETEMGLNWNGSDSEKEELRENMMHVSITHHVQQQQLLNK